MSYNEVCSGIKENEAQTTVAIKTLNPYSNKDVLKSLMSELKIMSHLGQHPNIVNLLGAITTNIQRSELCLTLVVIWLDKIRTIVHKLPQPIPGLSVF